MAQSKRKHKRNDFYNLTKEEVFRSYAMLDHRRPPPIRSMKNSLRIDQAKRNIMNKKIKIRELSDKFDKNKKEIEQLKRTKKNCEDKLKKKK